MSMDSWKGNSIVSGYDIDLYRKHMAPLVTADTLDEGCTSLSEYLTTVPKGKAWVDALLSSSKYLVLDLCLYLQDTLGVDVERAEVYVEEGTGMRVSFLSYPRIELRLFDPEWNTPSLYTLSVRTSSVVARDSSGYKLANGLRSLPDIIQKVLGMEACSTCTFSNDNNRYCGAGAQMYTDNCTQRETKELTIDITMRGATS